MAPMDAAANMASRASQQFGMYPEYIVNVLVPHVQCLAETEYIVNVLISHVQCLAEIEFLLV